MDNPTHRLRHLCRQIRPVLPFTFSSAIILNDHIVACCWGNCCKWWKCNLPLPLQEWWELLQAHHLQAHHLLHLTSAPRNHRQRNTKEDNVQKQTEPFFQLHIPNFHVNYRIKIFCFSFCRHYWARNLQVNFGRTSKQHFVNQTGISCNEINNYGFVCTN